MIPALLTASLRETLGVVSDVLLPTIAKGAIIRRRRVVAAAERMGLDRAAACERAGIEHRLTKPYHPWTNGQVERMNRTSKDATVRRHLYDSHDQLRAHPQLFLDAYDHARA